MPLSVTPGAMLMIWHGSRAVGTFSRTSRENVPPVFVLFVSTTGDAALTLTSAVIAPTSIFWSIIALNPVVSTTPGRETFLKLLSSNVTV